MDPGKWTCITEITEKGNMLAAITHAAISGLLGGPCSYSSGKLCLYRSSQVSTCHLVHSVLHSYLLGGTGETRAALGGWSSVQLYRVARELWIVISIVVASWGGSDFDVHKRDSTQRLLRFTRLTNMRRPQVWGVGKHYRCCISALETTQSRWTGEPRVHWLQSTLLLRRPAMLQRNTASEDPSSLESD